MMSLVTGYSHGKAARAVVRTDMWQEGAPAKDLACQREYSPLITAPIHYCSLEGREDNRHLDGDGKQADEAAPRSALDHRVPGAPYARIAGVLALRNCTIDPIPGFWLSVVKNASYTHGMPIQRNLPVIRFFI